MRLGMLICRQNAVRHSKPHFQTVIDLMTLARLFTIVVLLLSMSRLVHAQVDGAVAYPVGVQFQTQGNQPAEYRVAQPQQFHVIFTNLHPQAMTIQIGQQSQELQPGESWRVWTYDGQAYGVVNNTPVRLASGRWVSGGTYSGTVSADQTTIELGKRQQPADVPQPQPPTSFHVTFVNEYQSPVTIKLLDATGQTIGRQELRPGQQVGAFVSEGFTYEQQGPVVFRTGGAVSGTRRGHLTEMNRWISLRD